MKVLILTCVMMFAVGGNSLEIVSMQEWSGENTRRTDILNNPVSMAIVLHTVTPECNSDKACQQLLKSMRNTFLGAGFTDMAYNFMIGSNGKVYEGAGWNLIGAHTRGYNDKSIGISFIGDFRDKTPTPEALQAAQDLLTFGVENKHLSEDYKLVGHRQVTSTISPGDALQQVIEGWPHWVNV